MRGRVDQRGNGRSVTVMLDVDYGVCKRCLLGEAESVYLTSVECILHFMIPFFNSFPLGFGHGIRKISITRS